MDDVYVWLACLLLLLGCISVAELIWRKLVKHLKFFRWLEQTEYEKTIEELKVK
jgi:hypothetical protein